MAIPPPRDPQVTRERLGGWLAGKLGRPVEIAHVEIPRQGFSSETLMIDASWEGEAGARSERLVVRVEAQGHQLMPTAGVGLQWSMMSALSANSAIPVPPLFFEEPATELLGAPFYAMGFVPGHVPSDLPSYHVAGWLHDDVDPARRAQVWLNGVDVLAALHGLDWRDGFAFLDRGGSGVPGLERHLRWVGDWYAWAAKGRPLPIADAALAHLDAHRPSDARVGVVWGDARPGNMVFGDDLSVAAVLDWELATLGPGELDLGWWLFQDRSFGEGFGHARLEGLPSREEVVARYEARRGTPVRDLHFYEVLAGLATAIVWIRTVDLQVEYGMLAPETTLATANPATCVLADLLGLPSPGLAPELEALKASLASGERAENA